MKLLLEHFDLLTSVFSRPQIAYLVDIEYFYFVDFVRYFECYSL